MKSFQNFWNPSFLTSVDNLMPSSSSDFHNSSILESNRSNSISINMWCFLNCSIIISSKWFCSLVHWWLEARMFLLMACPVNEFRIFVRVEFFSNKDDGVRVVTVTFPVFGMDENFISTIVEIPEIHIPELEMTMSNFFWESNKNWEFTSIFGNFDLSTKTITNWPCLSVTNFPGVNNFKTGTSFTGLNRSVLINLSNKFVWAIQYGSTNMTYSLWDIENLSVEEKIHTVGSSQPLSVFHGATSILWLHSRQSSVGSGTYVYSQMYPLIFS